MRLGTCAAVTAICMGATIGAAQQSEITAVSLLAERLHAAWAAKDAERIVALWSEKLRAAQRDATAKSLKAAGDAGIHESTVKEPELAGDRARVRVDREVGTVKSKLVLECAREQGEWKIIKETPAAEDLAARVAGAATEDERTQLLARNEDLPTSELANALLKLATEQRNRGNSQQALSLDQLALTLAERAGAGEEAALAQDGIGLVEFDLGAYAEALESHRKSLARSEALHDDAGMARSLGNMGAVYSATGELDAAIESLQRSLNLSEKLNAKRSISSALGNLGAIYARRGDYAQALALMNRSHDLDVASGNQRGVAASLLNIGNVFLYQGDNAQGQKHFEQGLELAKSAGIKAFVGVALMGLGRVAEFEGNLRGAIDQYEKALAILNEIGNRPYAAAVLTYIGSAYSSLGDQPKALEYFQKGLEAEKALGEGSETYLTMARMAEVYNRKGDSQAALRTAGEATDASEPAGMREVVWRARLEQGKALRALGKPAEAEGEFGKSIETIEALRRDVAGAESEQEGSFEGKLEPYHRMVDLLVASGRDAEAFQYAERAKARVLLDVLKNGRAQLAAAMSDEERGREQQLRMKLASLNAKLVRSRQGSTPAQFASLNADLNRARLEYDGYETALYAQHPQWKLGNGAVEPVSFPQAVELMGGTETAFVEFAVSEEKLYGFVATGGSDKVKVFSSSVSRKDLEERVEQFRKQLAGRDLGFRATAQSFYKQLLAPAQDVLAGTRQLIIVPDGVLWELPFQALANASGKYLLESCSVSYAPSLTALKAMIGVKQQRRQSNAGTQLLAMGNPTWSRETGERIKAIYRDQELGNLPMAETEVRRLSGIYGADQSHIYIGPEARESRFKAEASSAKVLHLATHGILNNASPLYSYLLLAGDTAKGEDGLLEARELLQMKLDAELAVLSACETARGHVGAGEGVIGLSWALLVSGVPTTVLSQWKVESESTSRLMVAFHQNRKKGMSDAESLRAAALAIRKDPAFQHPFYWAPFIVIGASSPGSPGAQK